MYKNDDFSINITAYYKKQLFLSYCWDDSKLADKIDDELQNLGFDIKRDIRDIGPWKSIKEFMSTIRKQDYAIIIISSNYLKSKNCMYEVLELLKDINYKDKIFSVVTNDADIYDPISRAKYIKYWENESKKLEESLGELKLENIHELTSDLRLYKSIERSIASFLDLISDKNNPQIIDSIEKIKEVIFNDMTLDNGNQIKNPDNVFNILPLIEEALNTIKIQIISGKNKYNENDLLSIIKNCNVYNEKIIDELYSKYVMFFLIKIFSDNKNIFNFTKTDSNYLIDIIGFQNDVNRNNYGIVKNNSIQIQVGDNYNLLENAMWPILPTEKEVILNEIREKIKNES